MTTKSLMMTCGVNVIFKNNKTCVNNLLYVYIRKIRVYFVYYQCIEFFNTFWFVIMLDYLNLAFFFVMKCLF